MSFVYLQHRFHCLINKTVNQINFSLLISCLSMSNVNFINKYFVLNKTVKNGKAVIIVDLTCDMIISRETGQLLRMIQI